MIKCNLYNFIKHFKFVCDNIDTHYKEASGRHHYDELDIDYDYFWNAAKSGRCLIATLEDDGNIVGYSIFTVGRTPLRRSTIEANNICVWVSKKYRNTGAFKLMKFSIDKLLSIGIENINFIVKDEALSKIINKLGGVKQDSWSVSNV